MRPKLKHRSKFGVITLRYRKKSRTLTYEQKGGNQTAVDRYGVSLDAYIHALFGLVTQSAAKKVLMIGCGGGALGTMLARSGRHVTIVDIDKVPFALAKRYFGLPAAVTCHVGDGLTFLQNTRRRYDVLIVDAFIGEDMPAHMKGETFYTAARRCLRDDGIAFVNVCLNRKSDPAADGISQRFHAAGWSVRLLDEPGGERNAIVMAGAVKSLRRPQMLMPPATDEKQARRRLKAMRFRRRRAVSPRL